MLNAKEAWGSGKKECCPDEEIVVGKIALPGKGGVIGAPEVWEGSFLRLVVQIPENLHKGP